MDQWRHDVIIYRVSGKDALEELKRTCVHTYVLEMINYHFVVSVIRSLMTSSSKIIFLKAAFFVG